MKRERFISNAPRYRRVRQSHTRRNGLLVVILDDLRSGSAGRHFHRRHSPASLWGMPTSLIFPQIESLRLHHVRGSAVRVSALAQHRKRSQGCAVASMLPPSPPPAHDTEPYLQHGQPGNPACAKLGLRGHGGALLAPRSVLECDVELLPLTPYLTLTLT